MSDKRDVETAELSIWFFCGILMLAYGVVLIVTGMREFHHSSADGPGESASDSMVGHIDGCLRRFLYVPVLAETQAVLSPRWPRFGDVDAEVDDAPWPDHWHKLKRALPAMIHV